MYSGMPPLNGQVSPLPYLQASWRALWEAPGMGDWWIGGFYVIPTEPDAVELKNR